MQSVLAPTFPSDWRTILAVVSRPLSERLCSGMPRAAVASIVGIGGTAGAASAWLMAKATGVVLQVTQSYALIFIGMTTLYLIALAVIHGLSPKLAPARF